MAQLKFENLAKVGDTIRGLDFEPRPGRADCYIEGPVVEVRSAEEHARQTGRWYGCYVIRIERDTMADDQHTRVGDLGFVPFETTFDFDDRVQLVARADALRRAALVIQLTPHIRAYLAEHDPKALEQLDAALGGCPAVPPAFPQPEEAGRG